MIDLTKFKIESRRIEADDSSSGLATIHVEVFYNGRLIQKYEFHASWQPRSFRIEKCKAFAALWNEYILRYNVGSDEEIAGYRFSLPDNNTQEIA